MSWSVTKFENLYAEPLRNGIYKSKEFHGAGTKIVNMGELFNFDFISSQEMLRIKLTESELEKNSLDDGDLIFGRRSVVESGAGKCSIVLSPSESLVFESSIIRVRLDKSKVNPLFYFYWFKSPRGRAVIKAIVTGANVKGIKGSDLRNILVDEPPKKTQDIIADSARNYDLLIQTNQQRIALLEEAAQRLYDEWFVKLRFPNHEQVPVVEGVPEGWKVKKLKELSDYLGRGISPKYDDNGKYIVIGQKCIRDKKLYLEIARRQNNDYGDGKGVHLGDVLINSTGTGTLGRVTQVLTSLKLTTVDTHITIVRPRKEIPYLWFGSTLLNLEKVFEEMGEGATNQQELKRTRLGELSLVLPNPDLMEKFHRNIKPLKEQLANLIEQNQKLTQARDELLPRLMSGQLDISKLI